MFEGAFGSLNAVADTLVKATPLLLVAVGICIAFRGGMLNIGGEGQPMSARWPPLPPSYSHLRCPPGP
jgi:ABC-type uncharacterized transport system permease subunit